MQIQSALLRQLYRKNDQHKIFSQQIRALMSKSFIGKMPNGSSVPYATRMDLIDIQTMELPLTAQIKDRILEKGPISMNDYWNVALLDEKHGYYMKNDVISAKGDFITSVEISQMFGEILGIWAINLLSQIKAIDIQNPDNSKGKKKFSLLEFGPGRGTLMSDIVRVLSQFQLLDGIEINFVEFSPFMRKLQQEKVIAQLQEAGIYMKFNVEKAKRSQVEEFISEDPTRFVSLRWFKMYENFLFEDFGENAISELSNGKDLSPIIVFAHEFFDALPACIFEYDHKQGWCEKLVNICHDPKKMRNFEWTLSDGPNENVKRILNPQVSFSELQRKNIKQGDMIEVQTKSLIITNSLAELIKKRNGGMLAIDYGENQAFSDSIRGIRRHKFIQNQDILEYPGEIDLSAYVNFAHLSEAARKVSGIISGGPIPQGLFLESMGLNTRLEMLCRQVNEKKKKQLEQEYFRLVAPEEMGGTYKCFYVGLEKNGEIFPFITENKNQAYY